MSSCYSKDHGTPLDETLSGSLRTKACEKETSFHLPKSRTSPYLKHTLITKLLSVDQNCNFSSKGIRHTSYLEKLSAEVKCDCMHVFEWHECGCARVSRTLVPSAGGKNKRKLVTNEQNPHKILLIP